MDKLENFEAQSSALILNHLQTAILSSSSLAPSEPEDLARMDAAVERCAEALAAARKANILIVHVRIAFSTGYPEANRNSPMMRFMIKENVLLDGDPEQNLTLVSVLLRMKSWLRIMQSVHSLEPQSTSCFVFKESRRPSLEV